MSWRRVFGIYCAGLGALWLTAGATWAADYRLGERLAGSGPRQVAGYQVIRWDDLMPKNWDPMAELRGLNLRNLQDNDPRAQAALEKVRRAWDKAPVEPSWDGKSIRLAGFVVPLEGQGAFTTEWLLVPYFGACIHTPPPPINQTIHVQSKKPVVNLQIMDAYWVSGILKVEKGESREGSYGYRLWAEQVERYQAPGKR